MAVEPSSTLYMPIVSPPTPAPSPRLGPTAVLDGSPPPSDDPAFLSRREFSGLTAAARRRYLASILADCTPPELLFISTTIAPLLKRDFLRDLPPEVSLYILSFVDDPITLSRASRVSRYWNRLLADEWLWKNMCVDHGFANEMNAVETYRRARDDADIVMEDQGDSSSDALSTLDQGRNPIHHSAGSSSSTSTLGLQPMHFAQPNPQFLYREYFRYAYITTSNWLHGGRLLRVHRSPLLPSPHLLPNAPAPMNAPPNPPQNLTQAAAIPTSIALDASWIVVGLANSRIHVFSARTGVLSRTLVGHESGVWAVALVKGGGESAVEAHEELNVAREDVPTGGEYTGSQEHLVPATLRYALGLDQALTGSPKHARRKSACEVFSEDTGYVRSESAPRVDKTSDPTGTSDGWGQPNALVVSGGCDKELRVWDVKSGYCIYVLRGHTSTIRCLKVLHGRPIAVSGSRDRTVRVWDIQRGRLLRVLEGHEQSVRCLDVYGNKVVSGSYDCTCRLWDVDTGACLHVLRGHFHQIYSVAFDGLRIASGGLDTTVRVWDAATGVCLALLQGHTALVCQLQLTPTMLATGGSDGRVITFSLNSSFSVIQRLAAHDSSVSGLQLDDRFLVTGGNDGRVRLFQFQRQTGNCEYVRELSEPSESVWKVAFTRETCAIMCKRAGKMVMEIWSFKPEADT